MKPFKLQPGMKEETAGNHFNRAVQTKHPLVLTHRSRFSSMLYCGKVWKKTLYSAGCPFGQKKPAVRESLTAGLSNAYKKDIFGKSVSSFELARWGMLILCAWLQPLSMQSLFLFVLQIEGQHQPNKISSFPDYPDIAALCGFQSQVLLIGLC